MTSSTSNDENEKLEIVYHKATNKIDDSFIGIKIRNNKVDFYYPETYNFDDSSLETARNDVLAILQTISIAKTHSNSNVKIESTFSNNEAIPLLSYLWIIRDYLQNGLYINKEKVFKKNQRGKVDWKRTLNEQPIISKGNVIYSNIIVSVKSELDNIIVQIHKYCVKKSFDILGWLFGINGSSFIEMPPFHVELKPLYIDALRKELSSTFDDKKKIMLGHMLSIIEGLSDDQNANEIVYGVDSYAYIFERMINSIFGNRDATKFNPSADWYLTIDNYKAFASSDLRPDTILIRDNIAYVLDSKFYCFGYTFDKKDLPETTSIQKQITYGDFIKTNKMGDEIQKVRNAFILPYNKNSKYNTYGFEKTIEYIGYSKTDYRKGLDDHEIIHAFLIDLKYVVETWNKRNHGNDINELVTQIEKVQKERIKVEKENEFAKNVVKINDGQTFSGGILNSFYATLGNKKLKQTLLNKQILYVDGYFVINDKKYVKIDDNNKKKLTNYAFRNMNECCLAFNTTESLTDEDFKYDFCKNCEARKKTISKTIQSSDKHNERILIRAQDSDIDRILEDNRDAIELKNKIAGCSFGHSIEILKEECGFDSDNSLKNESDIDNHKIAKFIKGTSLPKIQECVALCAAFELHPIVARQFLLNAGFDLQSSSSEQYLFYNFLITYCYGDDLNEWNLKIAETNHMEWQIP